MRWALEMIENCQRMTTLDLKIMRIFLEINYQNVFTCFIWMELNVFVHAGRGDQCKIPYKKLCSNSKGTHVESMHSCLSHNAQRYLTWHDAKADCKNGGGALIEPDTLAKIRGVHAYASKHRLNHYWIGLSYDQKQAKLFWSSDGRPLEKEHTQILDGPKKGVCVKAVYRQVVIWEKQDCTVQHRFICSTHSELMPGRPRHFVDQGLNKTKFEVGSSLVVKCEALLSMKGELRIAIFSAEHVQFINQLNDPDAIYNENLTLDYKNICKRHGSLIVTLEATLNMAGKTLACISFIEPEMDMCSPYDPYCDIAGTIDVKVPVVMWWPMAVVLTVAILILMICRLYMTGSAPDQDNSSSGGSTTGST